MGTPTELMAAGDALKAPAGMTAAGEAGVVAGKVMVAEDSGKKPPSQTVASQEVLLKQGLSSKRGR